MKKLLVVFMLSICLFFVGCNASDSTVLNNMSDLRINFFEGQNQNIYANLSCGQREEVFAYDGTSTNPVECGVLTVGFFAECSYASISIVLNIDGKEAEYVLEKSPYENVFMEDIGYIVNSDSKVSLKLKNTQSEVALTEVSGTWAINYKKAIQIGSNYFKDQIESLYFNGTFHAECYLKVASKIDYDKKFWYFSMVDQSNNNYSLLIDVNSGEVISNS